ncbi:unnamed protein product [Larinioides sclopetarius]|uniref:Uncharacterized protein n=1 Tax=Larinioides sclopetarius TaxID=280406 RepID=A0AAV2BEU7_9ARAC
MVYYSHRWNTCFLPGYDKYGSCLLGLLRHCTSHCTVSGNNRIDILLSSDLIVAADFLYMHIVWGSKNNRNSQNCCRSLRTTVLFVQTEDDRTCNRTSTKNEDFFKEQFNTTAPRTADPFCTSTLPIFSYSVLVVFHVLLFFSLLVTFYDNSK